MFSALLQMSRIGNACIAIATLAAGYFLCQANFSWCGFLADTIAFTLAISFGNIHNDFLDIETDKLNRPNRPLPAGKISIRSVKISIFILIFLTLLLAFLPNVQSLIHLSFFSALLFILFVYNRFAKHVPLLKNLTVAFLCITPLLRAMLLDSAQIFPLIPPILFAFLYTLSREIQKDLEDISGDKAANILTLPIATSESLATKLASFQILLAWFLLPLPVLLKWYHSTFLFALLPMTPLSIWILLSLHKKKYSTAQKITKIIMICGLLSLILSQVIY